MIKIYEYMNVLEKLEITQSDFMFLYCTYTNKVSVLDRYKKLFPSDDNTYIGKKNIDRLKDKGLIRLSNANNKIITTEKFNDLFVSEVGAFEIYELYPVNLRVLNKYEFRVLYNESIEFNLKEHKKIKQLLKYANKSGISLPTISSFVKSQYWDEIKIIKNNSKKVV